MRSSLLPGPPTLLSITDFCHNVGIQASLKGHMHAEYSGGYCFELNGLLAAVLRALGYDLYEAAAHIVKGVDEDTGMV